MQGSVWGSLMCTASMSKIGELAYKNQELCYSYRGKVIVPPLGMIDDLLSIQKCNLSSTPNTVINAFVELKKLKFGQTKCSQIHIGRNKNACKNLKVHGHEMKKSQREKYLGDIVSEKGDQKDNIAERVAKGYAIINEIKAILNEIPL